MKNQVKILILFLSCAFVISCDQVTKELARDHLKNKEDISYFYDTFRFMYAENTGAALGLGDNLPQPYSFWLLSMLPLFILIAALIYIMKKIHELNTSKLLAISFMIAGGLGNIIDRIIFDRHVTDFMNMGIGPIRTGIFNVADLFITIGLILFILTSWKNERQISN